MEEDFEAVKRVLSGDRNAFTILQNKYKKLISNLIRKMIKDEDDIDDLTQETFIKAYNALDSFRFGFAFSAWLYRIASNNCIDFLRKKRFQTISLNKPIFDKEDDQYIQIEDTTARPDIEYLNKEKREIINEAIEKLPENYREIIKLRHEFEMEYTDIANELKIPIGTVKAHLFRARKILLADLKEKKHILFDS